MVKIKQTTGFHAIFQQVIEKIGNFLVDVFHFLALFAIGSAIVWSATNTFIDMIGKGNPSIADILILFIYLELGAMVGIYFKTNHMPVRFLIFVAITALTRMLIGVIQADHEPDVSILYISGATLLLACADIVIRYGSNKLPASNSHENAED